MRPAKCGGYWVRETAAETGLAMPDFTQVLQANISYQLATDFGRVPHKIGAGLRPTAGMMTYGQGNWQQPRVILLHGLPLDHHSWDGVVAELPAGDVLCVDCSLFYLVYASKIGV